MNQNVKLYIEDVRKLYNKFLNEKEHVNNKIANELISYFKSGKYVDLSIGFRNWTSVIYDILYQNKNKRNRIGVSGGDYFEEITYCLLRELVHSIPEGKEFNVVREEITRTKKGKGKRIDILIKDKLGKPRICIELKAALDKSQLTSCYNDYNIIDGFEGQRYFCFGAALYTKIGQKLDSILGKVQSKRWAYVLPEPKNDDINEETYIDMVQNYRGKKEGFGELGEFLKEIVAILKA